MFHYFINCSLVSGDRFDCLHVSRCSGRSPLTDSVRTLWSKLDFNPEQKMILTQGITQADKAYRSELWTPHFRHNFQLFSAPQFLILAGGVARTTGIGVQGKAHLGRGSSVF